MNEELHRLLELFDDTFHDHGDERYGLVKHNNTILQKQYDWLQERIGDLLAQERLRLVEVIEGMKIPCMGDPEMMQSLEDRFKNKAFQEVISRLTTDHD